MVGKRQVRLPDTLVGIVRCPNPKCITNNEPMATRFEVADRASTTLRCCYCNRCVDGKDAEIL